MNNTDTDFLAPGAGDFAWGVDLRLDDGNTISGPAGTTGTNPPGGSDDGNNIFQRGRADSSSQFKLENDTADRRPRCVVRDQPGPTTAAVAAPTALAAGTTYRVRCVKTSDKLAIEVRAFNAAGQLGALEITEVPHTLNPLVFPVSMPMSVGGKLNPIGTIAKNAPDPFNGSIDNAVFELLD